MAVIKCPECGNSVSDRAERCPKCAYPIAGSEVGTTQVYGSKIDQTAEPDSLAKSWAENKQRWAEMTLEERSAITGQAGLGVRTRATKRLQEQRLVITRRVCFALVVVGVLIAALFAPAIPLWFGFVLFMLCIAAFIKAGTDLMMSDRMDTTTTAGKMVTHILAFLSVVQNFSRRLLGLNPNEKWRSGLRFAMFGLIGLVLIVAGRTGAGYKAERARIAAKQEADREIIAAKQAAAEADQRRLTNEANAKVDALLADATKAVKAGDIDTARKKLKTALGVPHANTLADARKLGQKIDNATDPTRVRAALMGLSDETLKELKESGTLPAQMVSGYVGLDRRTADLAKEEVPWVAEARENRRLAQLEAERRRQEKARLAAEAVARKAEEKLAAAKTIPYEFLENVKHGVTGKLIMSLVVNEAASREEVLKLAESLRREHAGKYSTISIFDSREACRAVMAFDLSYPEKKLSRHWLIVVNGDGDTIRWVAEGRDH